MKYKRKNLVSEKVGDETLIIDHEKGRLITLNQTAGYIWDLLKTPKTEKEVLDSYTKKYGRDKARDSLKALKDLKKPGVIVQQRS